MLNRARYLKNVQNDDSGYNTLYQLTMHRKITVRNEARAALIAYAFIRNKPFVTLNEPTPDLSINGPLSINGEFATVLYTRNNLLWLRVARLVYKYGRNNLNKPLYVGDSCHPNTKIKRQFLIDWILGKS